MCHSFKLMARLLIEFWRGRLIVMKEAIKAKLQINFFTIVTLMLPSKNEQSTRTKLRSSTFIIMQHNTFIFFHFHCISDKPFSKLSRKIMYKNPNLDARLIDNTVYTVNGY